MRKLLLSLTMLMAGAMAVWAQEPVLTYENITAPKELSAVDAATIRAMEGMTIVADVNITNSSNVSLLFTAVADYTSASTDNNTIWGLGFGGNQMRYIVGPRTGGWYSYGSISTSAKKIAYTYDGSKIKYYVDGSPQGEVGSTKALNTFSGDDAKFYLGGVVYNTDTKWGTFNGTIKKVEIYNQVLSADQIESLVFPEGFVATAEDFDNNKIYTFVTERGWMGAKADNDKVISTVYSSNSGVSYGKDEANFQWAVYKSANDNYYLYNIGKQKFMGVQKSNNTAISFVDTPAGKDLTFKTSNVKCYPIMFSTDNAAVVNHSANHNPGIVSWTGGWNNLTDQGSNHQVIAVGELDKETLAKIETEVAKIEVDNTQEVAALGAAITKAESFLNQITIGTGVGNYSTTYENAKTEFEAIKSFYEAIESKETPTPAEVEEKTAEVETIIASFSLNMPEAGKYYRIFAVDDHNDDARYLGAQNKAETTRAEFVAESDVNTIFYFDGTYLLSYASNMYLANNGGFIGYNGSNKTNVEFRAAAKGLIGAYNLRYENTTRCMYCHAGENRTDGGSSTNDENGYCFNLEEVEENERIALSEAKIGDTYYATFENAMAAEGDGEVELLVEKSIVLNDGEAYTYTKDAADLYVEYTRPLIADIWNPVYLPFDFNLESDEFEVAEFTSAEGATVTLTKLEANEYGYIDLFANIAYVVRPIGENTTLDLGIVGLISKNEEVVQVLGNGFSVRGNYSVLKGENLGANDRIVSKDGKWAKLAGTSTLKPFRLILSIPAGVDASAISMRVEGEDTTSIETLETMTEVTIYDLMGRRVETMTEGGIYIVNGKKVIR